MSDSGKKDLNVSVEDDSGNTISAVQTDRDGQPASKAPEIDGERIAGQRNLPAMKVQHDADGILVDGDVDVDADGDSEAETLIQSPEKKRNSVAEGAIIMHQVKAADSDAGSVVVLASMSDKENTTRKRKRSNEEGPPASPSRVSSHRSSPLSSPVAHIHSEPESESGSESISEGERDSNNSTASFNKTSPHVHDETDNRNRISPSRKRKQQPTDTVAPSLSRKRSKPDSVDASERRETRSATYPRPSDDEKSPSPEPIPRREHRRGASTQLITGEHEKRRRGRPPQINTRRNRSADRADDSSDESEPRTNRARPLLHKLTSIDHDTMSPAKVGPRKWKDKNGRTYLARACANDDLDAARSKLAERPEDLNIGDNAGNTPLQIASLEGFGTIVEFLLSKRAEVNVRNVDKDTPLIDAVENGHVDVIKLLLDYGADPRMANRKGEEPFELVHTDDEAYLEIRGLLKEAKEKDARKTPGNDAPDLQTRDGASSRAASAASPRDSPPAGPRSPPALGSRRRTGRSESTRNDLLWQANTQENLAKLASKGDVQGVANILSILEKADTEALIAAAKAGHEEVLQLLIAMGKPDADPDPVRGSKVAIGYNTPMLAAIGRGHTDVVKLLASQSGFNPTRRIRDRTYFELAEERRGNRWEEEYSILKQAYDKYSVSKGRKPSSPRRTRDIDKSKPRSQPRSSSANSTQRQMPSPTATHKSLPSKPADSAHGEKRKVSDPSADKRRASGSGEMADSSFAIASDFEQMATTQRRGHRTRRSQSDLPPVPALESESTYKRRRLVTGKEHRSRQTISTSSENDDSDALEVKQEERFPSVLKRARLSSTPDPLGDSKDRLTAKKRRTVLESSPDEARMRNSILDEHTQLDPEIDSKLKADEETAESGETKAQPEQRKQPISLGANAATGFVEQERPAVVPSKTTELDTLPDADAKEHNHYPEAEDEDEDPYSPPPAIEASDDWREKEEAEERGRQAKEEADRLAAEEAVRQEQHLKAVQERRAKEQAMELARLRQEAEERQRLEAEQVRQQREEQQQRRQKEEEEEQQRLKREMELKLQQEQEEQAEQERLRLDALPIVLARTAHMINEEDSDVLGDKWLSKLLPLYSVKTRQLDPSCEPSSADEEWVPNFQVACLLATKDLRLQSYSPMTTRPVTGQEKHCLWRVARLKLSYDFNPAWTTTVEKANEIERIAQDKFMAMPDLFWVKLSDFMNQVPQHQFLNAINIARQPISLKPYTKQLGANIKTGGAWRLTPSTSAQNSHTVYTNGENGIS